MINPNTKITLLIPPSLFLLDERVFPSLGILKLASVLESHKIKVDVLDLSGIENFEEVLQDYLKKSESTHLGISVTTPQLPAAGKLVEIIRAAETNIKIILGGPHITLVSSAVKLEEKAGIKGRAARAFSHLEKLGDILVSGDGEFAILEAIQNDSPAFIDADEPKSGLFLNNKTYEETPYPARHMIDLESYKYKIEDHKSTSLIAQLGCPFHCGFCGGRNSKSLRFIRTRTTESIINEMRILYDTYGFTGYMFYDDELNVNKNMVQLMKEIEKLQKELGAEFRLRGFVKAELFTEEQAEVMYRAGFRWLLTGFESGSPRILQNIEKRATQEDNFNAVKYARNQGLKVKALMSIGHPGESKDTVKETEQWLLDAKPEEFDCTLITCYPGTPYYDKAVPHESLEGVYTYTTPKTKDRLHSVDLDYTQVQDYYKGDPNGGYKSYVFTDHLSSQELVSLRDELEKKVRGALNIPYYEATPAIKYEHSMGQAGDHFPDFILRKSSP